MKFGALLRNSAAELPELHQLFVSYKQLKKRLKRLPERQELVRQRVRVAGGELPEMDVRDVREQEEAFVQKLDQDVQEFNSLFLDKEEDNVIQLSSLEDEAAAAQTPDQLHAVYKRFVNFHGELLLMVHWSILAYTGLVKILKKHHKRTGLLVRAPHLDNLLSQPFCSIELTTALIRKAEQAVNGIIPKLSNQGSVADLSQCSPRASVQQLLHATRSLGAIPAAAGSAAGTDDDDNGIASSSSDDLDTAAGNSDHQLASTDNPEHSQKMRAQPHRKRQRTADAEGDDHATSARVRHTSRQHQTDPAVHMAPGVQIASLQPTPDASAVQSSGTRPDIQAAPISPFAAEAPTIAATDAPVAAITTAALPSSFPVPSSTSSQQGDCLAPDGSFVGRAAAAGLPPNILRQTRAALGLWEQLHETASTPSTVLPPINRHAIRTVSVGTDNSAA